MDLPAEFCEGYHTHSYLEMRPWKIFRRYLRTWCMLDAALIAVDWTFIVYGVEDDMIGAQSMPSGLRWEDMCRASKHGEITWTPTRVGSP
eukprot:4127611-Amphidinium_carterae.1